MGPGLVRKMVSIAGYMVTPVRDMATFSSLEPVNVTLFGTRASVDVIKLRILR